jgi:hypothetical protein
VSSAKRDVHGPAGGVPLASAMGHVGSPSGDGFSPGPGPPAAALLGRCRLGRDEVDDRPELELLAGVFEELDEVDEVFVISTVRAGTTVGGAWLRSWGRAPHFHRCHRVETSRGAAKRPH